MAGKTTYTCNICGVDRKEVNHWYAIVLKPEDYWVMTWDYAEESGILQDKETEHVCGQHCEGIRKSQWYAELERISSERKKEKEGSTHLGSVSDCVEGVLLSETPAEDICGDNSK